jgi:hypothetical protein
MNRSGTMFKSNIISHIISHRGNLDGPDKYTENHPDTLQAALNLGYGIEFDVWFEDGQWALGHDQPQYAVTFEYLLNLGHGGYREYPKVWMHLKNLKAIQEMNNINAYGCAGDDDIRQPAKHINYFWHQSDDVTITNHGHVWVHPNVHTIPYGSVWVVPETKSKVAGMYDYENPNWTRASFVCVDYPNAVKQTLSNSFKVI